MTRFFIFYRFVFQTTNIMDKDKRFSDNQPFDEDPDINCRIENDILQLKLQAEFGAQIHMAENIPPEVEKGFLEMVREIETREAEAPMISIFDYLGRPEFPPADQLDERSIAAELERLFRVLEENDLSVVVMKEHAPRAIYSFIRDELFREEIRDIRIPGMIGVFCYEDFHMDPDLELEQLTASFLEAWSHLKFSNLHRLLADYAVIPDGRIINQEVFIRKMQEQLRRYQSIEALTFQVTSCSHEWKDGSLGLGYVEGNVSYVAHYTGGDSAVLEDGFKFYYSYAGDYWRLTFFYLPGFDWI